VETAAIPVSFHQAYCMVHSKKTRVMTKAIVPMGNTGGGATLREGQPWFGVDAPVLDHVHVMKY